MEILGLLGGALGRLIPELVGYWKERQKAKERAEDRVHELAMLELSGKLAAAGHQQRMEAANLEADVALFRQGVEATRPISGHLATHTGMPRVDAAVALLGAVVDAANAAVRPLVTFWWVIVLYSMQKVALYIMARDAQATWAQAVGQIVTPFDTAVIASIIGFWFTDRVLRKYAGQ